jgi:DNA-binding transcriptional MerR regulator
MVLTQVQQIHTITATEFIYDFNTLEIRMGQPAIVIPEKIYFKIGEVCDLVGVQPHVLRYWETEFPMLSPQKNRSGQRSYRRRDVEISLRIKELLYEEMFTIAGAKKKLQIELRETSKLKIVHPDPQPVEVRSSDDSPSLFENEPDEDFEDLELSFDATPSFTADQRQALKSLASQLLELREMLKTNQTSEAEELIKNR